MQNTTTVPNCTQQVCGDPRPALPYAYRFLQLLTGQVSPKVTFQTFDDKKRNRSLAKILHGTVNEHEQTLRDLNRKGAGIYVMVNAGDLHGRAEENVTDIRAIFLDLDGSPLEPVLEWPFKPHLITRTSVDNESGAPHYQCFWLVTGFPVDKMLFSAAQKALCQKFNGDFKITQDLCRVMRIPGFCHRKRQPIRCELISTKSHSPYRVDEILAALGIDRATVTAPVERPKSKKRKRAILEGQESARWEHPAMDTKIPMGHPIPKGARKVTMFSYATSLRDNTQYREQTVCELLLGLNLKNCKPPLTEKQVRDRVKSAFKRRKRFRPCRRPGLYLDEGAIKIYTHLWKEAGGMKRIERSILEIATATRLSRRQVSRCTAMLEERDMLDVERGTGRGHRNRYLPKPLHEQVFQKGDIKVTSLNRYSKEEDCTILSTVQSYL